MVFLKLARAGEWLHEAEGRGLLGLPGNRRVKVGAEELPLVGLRTPVQHLKS